MKKVTKNLGMAAKVLMVALLIAGVSVDSFGQKKKKDKKKKDKKEKVLERPDKVGNGAVDAYVSSAFDIFEKNQEISKKLGDASGSVGDMGTMKADLQKQMTDIKDLLGKSKAAGDAAGKLPMKDKPKAVKAVKKGTDALNATQKAIPGQLEMIKTQSAKGK
ncbi:MAG: hypothetical protein COA97_09475 [Flavobacteriales bacterium]|nr:MAG: hypothetical protein COA97_09475 [Flavobacteriales bacterium]